MVVKFQKESQDLQAQLVDENSAKVRLQMEVDSKDSEIEQLQQKLAMLCSETASLSSADNENEDLHAQGLFQRRTSSSCYFNNRKCFLHLRMLNIIHE
jgi:Rho-associated protein kinase 2